MLSMWRDYLKRVTTAQRRWALKGLLPLFVVSLLQGCASAPLSFPIFMSVKNDLNPDQNNRPLSLVLRVYQLKDKTAFEQFSLSDLASQKSDDDIFANSLVSRREFVVVPGQDREIDIEVSSSARYVGVVAMFRQPDENRWKLLFRARELKDRHLLSIEKCGLFTSHVAKENLPDQDLSRPVKCAGLAQPADSQLKKDIPLKKLPKPQMQGAIKP